MTQHHHKKNNDVSWIEISHSQAQRMSNLRKETLYMLPLLAAFVIVVLYPTFTGLIMGTIVGGFGGIIIVRRQEVASSMIVIRGKPAVVIGLLWVLFAWGGAVLAVLAKTLNW